jgi:hypothetical protein
MVLRPRGLLVVWRGPVFNLCLESVHVVRSVLLVPVGEKGGSGSSLLLKGGLAFRFPEPDRKVPVVQMEELPKSESGKYHPDAG